MTEVGFIIQPGESIPEDVTGVSDTDGDVWWLTAIDHWHLGAGGGEPRGCEGTVELQRARVRANAPLTVTAVREQPAEPEPVSTEIYWPVGTGEALDNLRGVFTTEAAAKAALTTGFDYSSIVLDRSYPTAAEALGEDPCAVCGSCEPHGPHELVPHLFVRGGASLNRCKQVFGEAFCAHPPEAPIHVTPTASPDPSAPLVLSLPTVPPEAVALIGGITERRFTRMQTGAWLDEQTSQVMPLWRVLEREVSVTVVMREPRTWPQFEADPSDLPAVVEVDGHRWRRDPLGFYHTRTLMMADRMFRDLRLLGEVVEVFDDKDSTR